MGRNEICFCGSGRKQKRCHTNINENSLAARIIKLYGSIKRDLETDILGKVCVKGCNKCCQDYFAISEAEFAVIMDYLYNNLGEERTKEVIQTGIMLADEFEKHNPRYFKQLEENITGKSKYESARIEIANMPETQEQCVFLDEDGGCNIYEVRPIICRTHGTCYYSREIEHKICDRIPSSMENKKNMLLIDKYEEDILSINNYRKQDRELVLYRRRYPIVYFMRMYFGEGRSLSEYFKFPVVYNILHGTESMLYDCICQLNGIR